MQVAFLACLAVLVLAPAVRAQVNLAAGKNTTQSSYGDDTPGVPTVEKGQAVDGIYGKNDVTGKYSPDVCIFAKKNQDVPPWWAVDLGETHEVKSIRITNRAIKREWSNPMSIAVTDSFPFDAPQTVTEGRLKNYTLCQTITRTPELQETVNCSGTLQGRYVVIFITSGEKLYICEVEVYGTLVSTFTVQPDPGDGSDRGDLKPVSGRGPNTIIIGLSLVAVGTLAICLLMGFFFCIRPRARQDYEQMKK